MALNSTLAKRSAPTHALAQSTNSSGGSMAAQVQANCSEQQKANSSEAEATNSTAQEEKSADVKIAAN